MGDGTLAAAVALETTPAAYQLAQERGVRVLEVDASAIEWMQKNVWYYSASTMKQSELPKDSWSQPTFNTVSWMGPYLMAKKDLPDDLVYDIVKATHQNIKELAKANSLYKWAAENPKLMTTPNADMAWHPGAEKYWKEVGLWQGPKAR